MQTQHSLFYPRQLVQQTVFTAEYILLTYYSVHSLYGVPFTNLCNVHIQVLSSFARRDSGEGSYSELIFVKAC